MDTLPQPSRSNFSMVRLITHAYIRKMISRDGLGQLTAAYWTEPATE